MTTTIHEILEDNIIITSDSELGCIVTVNGAYWKLWTENGDGTYRYRDKRAADFHNGLYGERTANLWDKGCELLAEWTTPPLEEGDDVEGGSGEDYDYGTIEDIDGDSAFVAWGGSETKSWALLEDLRRC